MSESGIQTTVNQIESYAWDVRGRYGDKKDIVSQCDYMCYDLKDELSGIGVNREKMTVEQRRIGSDGQENHYILVIESSCVKHIKSDIWVDMSIDQFCNSNKEEGLVDVSFGSFDSIDTVRIMDQTDSRRNDYMSVEKFLRDSLSEI